MKIGAVDLGKKPILDKETTEKLVDQLHFEKLLASFSLAFINLPADKIDSEIVAWLKKILEKIDVDRATISQFAEENQLEFSHFVTVNLTKPDETSVVYDQSTNSSRLMNKYSVLHPYVSKKIKKRQIFQYSRISDLPDEAKHEKEHVLKEGIKSTVFIPLDAGGVLLGHIAFSSIKKERNWPDDLVQRLRLLGAVFANALLRKRSEQRLATAFREIKQLKEQLEAESILLREEIKLEHNFEEIIGNSEPLNHALNQVEQVAPTEATVLILGESGTGKELVARAIHSTSHRSSRPLVKVNCAALPSHLFESELFGHEKGAFTSALSKQIGRFEIADGSTIFLDEIGELSLEVQAKLLRVLQDGEFERLGSGRTLKVDVRVIAATNRNLEELVRKREFREDLWYRLNVFPIMTPPLRSRKEDIPLLAQHFINNLSKKHGKQVDKISQQAMAALVNYSWPGNIRELQNIIERAVITTTNRTLSIFLPTKNETFARKIKPLEEFERDYFIEILELKNWKISGPNSASEILEINPSTFRTRLKKMGIQNRKITV